MITYYHQIDMAKSQLTTKNLGMPKTKSDEQDKWYKQAQFLKKDGTRDKTTLLSSKR